ncbi:PPE family protein [Mycobacterium talmoniae]|uniref:PPE family protein PPE29 n=1 Tax=Mycobacterium talmoniae TaxID=1858794 RepID=A0A1S1NDR6_9MYCO|nr:MULTISPECIES: PPE family protein [Mycobacterium]OHU99121.1 hypothetical protein BKN37_19660 [Mycobacterium talmoniae]TDH51279.1 PPE family protein [Mycobacterium eburneum]
MDFGALPPEINSGRMYTGPGPGPMLAAAAAWDGLAAELHAAAAGYGSVIAELTSGPWSGPAAASMTAAAAPYVAWMHATALQAEETATQARAAVAAYEAAFAMTVPPPVIAANRLQLMTLVATNFFGQNTPAIAATEIHYAEMWAQDAAAMYGYAGSSSAASTVTPFTRPADTTNQAGLAAQGAAVAKAAGTQAGSSAQTAASTSSHLASTSAVPQVLQPLSSSAASPTTSTSTGSLSSFLPAPFGTGPALTTANYTTLLKQTLQGYFFTGIPQFLASIAQQLVPGTAGGAGAAGSAPLPGAGLPAAGSFGGAGGTPVSASLAKAGSIGRLSVPPSWAAGGAELNPTGAGTALSRVGAAASGDSQGLLRGIPLTGAGRRAGGGATYRYGFRYSVMSRPPSAG